MDDSSENEDIIFVPMNAPNAEQEKSIPLNASNDVLLEMSRTSGRHRKKPDYNAMNKGLGCKVETKFAPTHSTASSSGDPTPGTLPTPSSSVSTSLNSTRVPISGAGHFVQAAKKLSNNESLEANIAISRKKLQVSTHC